MNEVINKGRVGSPDIDASVCSCIRIYNVCTYVYTLSTGICFAGTHVSNLPGTSYV